MRLPVFAVRMWRVVQLLVEQLQYA